MRLRMDGDQLGGLQADADNEGSWCGRGECAIEISATIAEPVALPVPARHRGERDVRGQHVRLRGRDGNVLVAAHQRVSGVQRRKTGGARLTSTGGSGTRTVASCRSLNTGRRSGPPMSSGCRIFHRGSSVMPPSSSQRAMQLFGWKSSGQSPSKSTLQIIICSPP